jgi:FkbM family methyltransferase
MASTKKYFRTIVPRGVRNWLRSPSRSVRWVWDELKHTAGVNQIIEMRAGFSPVCHPGVYDFAYHLQHTDADQAEEFDGFIKYARPGMVLLDVGAHFGLFSLAALHYGGPRAVAVAVDPSPTAVRIVRIQARLNKVAERLHVIRASVNDHAGWQNMISVGVLASGYYVAPIEGYPESELSKTKSVTIDSLIDELKVSPTHIKIDVEGSEAAVLRGGHKVLSQTSAPILFLELHNEIVHSSGGNPQESLDLLREYGYETFTAEDLPLNGDQILSKPLIRIIARKPSVEPR